MLKRDIYVELECLPTPQNTWVTSLQLMIGHKTTCQSPFHSGNTLLFFRAGNVGMQLVPKTTRNPHQIRSVVLRLRAWPGAGCVWRRAPGEEGQTAGPIPLPLPRNLRGLDTSVRQKQTSRRAAAQTGVSGQRSGPEIPWTRWRGHRQVSWRRKHTCVCFYGYAPKVPPGSFYAPQCPLGGSIILVPLKTSWYLRYSQPEHNQTHTYGCYWGQVCICTFTFHRQQRPDTSEQKKKNLGIRKSNPLTLCNHFFFPPSEYRGKIGERLWMNDWMIHPALVTWSTCWRRALFQFSAIKPQRICESALL